MPTRRSVDNGGGTHCDSDLRAALESIGVEFIARTAAGRA
jgi:hypothetical protein